MSSGEIWLALALLALSTAITRCCFFLFGAVRLPPLVQHALRYAPAAALAAIVVPDLVLSGGALQISLSNPKLLAGIGAAGFFLVTRHLLGTIVAGMVFYTLCRLFM